MTQAHNLPAGWTTVSVGDLAQYINGLAFKPSDWEGSGRPIIRIQNLNGSPEFNKTTRDVADQFIVRPGDILVSWSATLDAFVWRGPVAVLNQHIFRVLPSEHVNRGFLFWGLKNAIAEMWESEHTHGTTMKHINRAPFLAHAFRLPPVDEQQRLSEALDSYATRLDECTTLLGRVQRNLKRYRASVLKAAVEGRLVPTEAELARAERRTYEPASALLERILTERRQRWEKEGRRGKYEEPALPNTKSLPELPEGWCWTTLRAVADIKGGLTKGQKRRPGDVLRSLPYLRVANVQRGYLDLSVMKEIEATDEEVEELRLRAGDVLFNEGGDRDKLGRGWIWEEQLPVCIHQNHVFRARLPAGLLLPKFMSWYGNSFGQRYFLDEGKQTTNLASINMTKLGALPVPIPPIAEQYRIVAEVERIFSVADAAGQTTGGQLLRLARLRQSILKWAFEGKLVDQDPNDEPASALLARIKGEAPPTDSPKATRRRAKSPA